MVLLDDRNEPLPVATAESLQKTIIRELSTLSSGKMTVRLLPPGRTVVATLVRDDTLPRRRIELSS